MAQRDAKWNRLRIIPCAVHLEKIVLINININQSVHNYHTLLYKSISHTVFDNASRWKIGNQENSKVQFSKDQNEFNACNVQLFTFVHFYKQFKH